DIFLSVDPVTRLQRGKKAAGNTDRAIEGVEQRTGISPHRLQKVPKQGGIIGWGRGITKKLRGLRAPRVTDGAGHIIGPHVSGGRRTPVLGAGAERVLPMSPANGVGIVPKRAVVAEVSCRRPRPVSVPARSRIKDDRILLAVGGVGAAEQD